MSVEWLKSRPKLLEGEWHSSVICYCGSRTASESGTSETAIVPVILTMEPIYSSNTDDLELFCYSLHLFLHPLSQHFGKRIEL